MRFRFEPEGQLFFLQRLASKLITNEIGSHAAAAACAPWYGGGFLAMLSMQCEGIVKSTFSSKQHRMILKCKNALVSILFQKGRIDETSAGIIRPRSSKLLYNERQKKVVMPCHECKGRHLGSRQQDPCM
jgi:hypothetical protein